MLYKLKFRSNDVYQRIPLKWKYGKVINYASTHLMVMNMQGLALFDTMELSNMNWHSNYSNEKGFWKNGDFLAILWEE